MKTGTSIPVLLLTLAIAAVALDAQRPVDGAWTIVEVWGETGAGEEWRQTEDIQPSLFVRAGPRRVAALPVELRGVA